MFIYNVTINVAEDVHTEWLRWMKEEHIDKVMQTGCFTGSQLYKVLVQDDGHTYSMQYTFAQMTDMERYNKQFAPALQVEMKAKFGESCLAFRTLLQQVN